MEGRIKGIVFDMDGVLVDSEWQYHLRRLDFLRQNGVELSERTLPEVIGLTYQAYVDMVLSIPGVNWTREEYRRRNDAYTRRVGRLRYNECMFPDVPETLSGLRAAGFRLGLASSSRRESVEHMLSDCGLEDMFHCVLAQEDVERVKPEPEIYQKAAGRLGLSPAECLAVEDSVYGIRSARAAGMTVVAKSSPHYTLDQSQSHWHIQEIGQLPDLLKGLEEK